VDKVNVGQTQHQWVFDTLAAAAANKQLEGDAFTAATLLTATRVSNYTQISIDPFLISGTNEAVRKWGRGSEIAYQKARSMKVIKQDIEMSIMGVSQGSVAGTAAVARRSGSLDSWIATNVDLAPTGGVAGGYSQGTGLTVAPTAGTLRAFAEASVKTMMQKCFTSGANPRTLYMAAAKKSAFSAFAGIAGVRHNQQPLKGQSIITGAADLYVSDFGTLAATPARQCLASTVFCIDHEYAGVAYLRPFETERLAKTGDSEKFNVIAEWTLVVKNEAAHGLVAGLS